MFRNAPNNCFSKPFGRNTHKPLIQELFHAPTSATQFHCSIGNDIPMHNEPREKLRELIVEYGRSLRDDPRRCEALLNDYCGQYKREISVLINALTKRVAEDLLKNSAGVPQVLLLARLSKRLEDELAMTAEAAKWAVESWALALGVIQQPLPAIKPVPALYIPSLAVQSPPLKKADEGGLLVVPPPPVLTTLSVSAHRLRTVVKPVPAQLILPVPPPRVSVALPIPPVLKPLSVFRDRLRDGSDGPAMIPIPAGEFWMGSPGNEEGRSSDERRHQVKIAQPFAIGQYAVTFDEYDRFCADRGRNKPEDRNWGRSNRPVINVSWLDALDYTDWLSAQTGQIYRLPTEAEWEYAARAGTETAFWWGNDISPDQANYDGNYTYRNGSKGLYREQTVPVDQFQPNPWGLYQVHGNVREWTGSKYDSAYSRARKTPSKSIGSTLALRGGSWINDPAWARSATRFWSSPAYRYNFGGFRLARSL